MGGERLVWIDGVRALAILLVIGFHVAYELTLDQNLRFIGYIGDSLFFIASGFMLAQRYPGIKKFDAKWLFRRYVKIASLYYPALIAMVLLFFANQGLLMNAYDLLLHFLFLNWISPDYLYSLISPAWFVIPLMAFYIAFPYLNRLMAWSKYAILVVFLITVADRIFEGGWASYYPIFFLGDFCFGIAFAQDRKNRALLAPLMTAAISPIMLVPYAAFYLLSFLENCKSALLGILPFIGRYTFELFLFHESVMKVALGKWNVYGLGVLPSLAVLLLSLLLVEKISIGIQRRLLPKAGD
ncbi:acyltransferase [Candidatus Micrarchaeota archaeon]|nr:acyltransferase [Candidatus Micrarchaeota archaeon]